MSASRGTNGKPGVYNATAAILSDKESTALAVDSSGRLIQSLSTVDEADGTPGTTPGIPAMGIYETSPSTLTNNQLGIVGLDTNRNVKTKEQYLPGYEDNTNNVAKVEHQYSYSRKTADGQVKGSAGFIHTVSISPLTATPTAGLLSIYDSTSETGTLIYTEWVFATTPGHSVILDTICNAGIYVGFDGTLANIAVTVSYR